MEAHVLHYFQNCLHLQKTLQTTTKFWIIKNLLDYDLEWPMFKFYASYAT